MSKWSELFREYRKAASKTQAEIAKDFDVASNTVSRWETGAYEIPGEVTWHLAEFFFGVPSTDDVSQAIRLLSGLQTQYDASQKPLGVIK